MKKEDLTTDALALINKYLLEGDGGEEVEFNGKFYVRGMLRIIRDFQRRDAEQKIKEDISSNIEFKARCWELAIRTPIEKGQSFFELSVKIGEFLLANPGASEYKPKKEKT